ncbi:MAG TPA: hypothetical protein VIJ79_08150 [Acidobacteriaceae bacterium]
MGRATKFLLTAAAVLLSSAAIARADTTYTVTTVSGDPNTLSGSISGTGMTLNSFDLTAVSLSQTLTFDSAVAGSSGSLIGEPEHIMSGTPINEFRFQGPDGEFLAFDVTGDFTSGFVYVVPQIVDLDGGGTTFDSGVALNNADEQPLPLGNLSLTPDVAAIPEPPSCLLLATGLTGLAATLRRRMKA